MVVHQIIHNVPLVSMFHGVTLALCATKGLPVKPMTTLLIAASSHNYVTPVGCSQNIIAAIAGGYSFGECARSGWLLQLISWITSVLFIWLWVVVHESLPEWLL